MSHNVICLSHGSLIRQSLCEEDDEYTLERLNNTDWYVQVLENTCNLSPNYIYTGVARSTIITSVCQYGYIAM